MCDICMYFSPLEAYHYRQWCIRIVIEEGEWFENEGTFVLYFDVAFEGRLLGRVDIVTKLAVSQDGLTLHAYQTDMHGLTRNQLGLSGIKAIAQAVMEDSNVDQLVVEANYRTTGANPRHTPRPYTFRREHGAVRKGDD
ncbi:hypothetical protein SAMN05880556_10114 [Azospirillum sp. RU38E]|nr:hypothetical protein SAMN05880556_10114 [Azospirillum sp. RU38E]SNR98987.1 hypothetical protein SAMN05880591_10114 [Azospirillum sp. RU37A]